jgi:hypothetical protein
VVRSLEARLTDGNTLLFEIVDLLCFEKKKKIVRGIDQAIP